MSEEFKLEVGSDKKSLSFALECDGTSYRAHLSKEFLDDNAGDGASIEERKKYALDNASQISDAAIKKVKGGFAREPFATGIVVTAE